MKFTEEYWKDVSRVLQVVPNVEKLCGHSALLTGATGMIVSAVADLLLWLNRERDFGMKIYLAGRNQLSMEKRFPMAIEGRDYRFVYFDAVTTTEFDLPVDFIINGASFADPVSFVKQPVETMMASLNGVHTLLETARKNNGCRFLQISSSEVYGKKDSLTPYRESEYGYVDAMNPRACYPSAKRAADTLCAAYTAEYGIDTVIVRPGHIYGPSITPTDSRVSSEFIRLAAEGENLIMKSSGKQMRSYCYTLDCASAILTVLLKGETSVAYNISNKDSVVTVRQMAEAFAKAGNVELLFVEATETDKKGYNMMENSSLDATRLETLGWKAFFGMKEGARKTIKDY